MQEIIARLSQIDSRSERIMEAATTEIKRINANAMKRKEDYLTDAMKRTDRQLASLRKELSSIKEKELSAQEANSQAALAQLEQNYNTAHAAISNRIFKTIIK